MRIRAILDVQKQMAKANICPKYWGNICQHKKHKDRKDRGRTNSNIMYFHSLAFFTAYLSVLLLFLKNRLPDPRKWCHAGTKHVSMGNNAQ